ncbi:PorP/SprF family type IX secretion system membrane protein [Aquimarina agarivorans]|uniref:PorP/SprF family type IX secretion system membrane protein n=1 Tax=Aquimarina agarivorans TaxID=980584 RepID=UPI002934EFA7|nr:type IX secretion system membrane protein PorP/SprF [Aquimarina agarivorans]
MNRFSIYIFILIGCIGTAALAQQDPQFTQYTINPLSVNSAYAGTRGHTTITGLHRSQWVGLDGAPRTQTLSIDTPLTRRVGLGFSVINDELGPSEETYVDLNFSYTILLDYNYKLSFGLKGGAQVFNLDFNKGRTREAGDNTFQNINNRFFSNSWGRFIFA